MPRTVENVPRAEVREQTLPLLQKAFQSFRLIK